MKVVSVGIDLSRDKNSPLDCLNCMYLSAEVYRYVSDSTTYILDRASRDHAPTQATWLGRNVTQKH